MSVYDKSGTELNSLYDYAGNEINFAYDIHGNLVYSKARSIVTWNKATSFSLGRNDVGRYAAWCPHNLQFDETRHLFIFLQSNRSRHATGTTYTMTLVSYDPAAPLSYTELNCPTFLGLGALLVDNGDWYIWTDTKRYKSSDGGTTWEEASLASSLPTRYGVYKIGNRLFMGDDSGSYGVYRVSDDFGITWQAMSFGSIGNYKDCEASFVGYRGAIYAFLRKNVDSAADENYLYARVLKSLDNGETWEIADDSHFLNYHSNCSPAVFDGFISVVSASRADRHLRYTVWNGAGAFIDDDLGFHQGPADDFHSPALAFGDGYMVVGFMQFSKGTSNTAGYLSCENMAMIGTYEAGKKIYVAAYHPENINLHNGKAANFLSTYGLDGLFPEEADRDLVHRSSSVARYLQNDNEFRITAYKTTDPMINFRPNQYAYHMRNGYPIVFCKETAKVSASDITTTFINNNFWFSIIKDGDDYFLAWPNSSGPVALQRRSVIVQSTATSGDLYDPDEPWFGFPVGGNGGTSHTEFFGEYVSYVEQYSE